MSLLRDRQTDGRKTNCNVLRGTGTFMGGRIIGWYGGATGGLGAALVVNR